MRFSPNVRKATLTVHLLCTIGWFGAVAGYLALALTGLCNPNPHLVGACYTAMALIGWWVIAPASAAALLTGILQALGTAWGLTRHWWVLLKLGITLFAVVALFVHLHPTSVMAEIAKVRDLAPGELGRTRWQLVIAPTLALILLAFNASLGVVKPSGLTPIGAGRKAERPLIRQLR
jgi:hypothetical protein